MLYREQKVPFSAKFTVVGGKMAPPPGGAPILQTCICFIKTFYAVLKITSYLLPAYQV